MALTNMHSDLRFNSFSGLCINLVKKNYYIILYYIIYYIILYYIILYYIILYYIISSITAPQDAHKRIVLQVYHGLNTLEFSAIHR